MAGTTVKVNQKNVEDFLVEMKGILNDEKFNIERDFDFVTIRASDEPDDEYTNMNTLLELEYDSYDVVEELKTLSIQEYTESMLDNRAEGIHFFMCLVEKYKAAMSILKCA